MIEDLARQHIAAWFRGETVVTLDCAGGSLSECKGYRECVIECAFLIAKRFEESGSGPLPLDRSALDAFRKFADDVWDSDSAGGYPHLRGMTGAQCLIAKSIAYAIVTGVYATSLGSAARPGLVAMSRQPCLDRYRDAVVTLPASAPVPASK